MVVALTSVAIFAGLLIRFRQIVGPLLIAFVLAYLLYPVANFLHSKIKISWRLSALILFVILLAIVVGLLTLGGLAVVDQVQSLIRFLQVQIRDLPRITAELTAHPLQIGIFELDLTTLDLTNLVNQLLGMVQPILSNTANIVGRIATSAAATIGWMFFAILIAYFILSDSGGVRARLINLQIPGYSEDLARMGLELSRIWNAFLRGQIIIIAITVLVYIPLLGSLGVSFYVGLAFLAGLARFVPYVGAWVTWITYALVTLFQGSTIFGLETGWYVLLVLASAVVVDFFLDNFVVPRLMGDALNIHPAAVMVAALISATVFGLVGVLLAAPVMATLKLVFNYVVRKMFDLDPWEGIVTIADREPAQLAKNITRIWNRFMQWLKGKINQRWPEGVPFFLWVENFGLWASRPFRGTTIKNPNHGKAGEIKPTSPANPNEGGKNEQLDGP